MKNFKEKVAILTSEKKMSDIVVDASAPPIAVAFKDKDSGIIKTAEYLKNDLLKHCKGLSELTWPLQLDELEEEKRNTQESLSYFTRIFYNQSQPCIKQTQNICKGYLIPSLQTSLQQ